LRGVTFDVKRGEMLALRGPSGSGKSTLLSILACADRPTAGRLELDGRAVERLADRALRRLRRSVLGVVFQNFHLLEALSVRDNVALPLVLLGRSRAEIRERVDRTLELVEIAELAERYPSELSGGQAQRVAIARAVVHEPPIVLADEPTGNLDSRTGDEIVRLLRTLASAGQTLIIATHAESVATACDRTLCLRDGLVSA
jgi:putative ABC transport system ATP-binding protein